MFSIFFFTCFFPPTRYTHAHKQDRAPRSNCWPAMMIFATRVATLLYKIYRKSRLNRPRGYLSFSLFFLSLPFASLLSGGFWGKKQRESWGFPLRHAAVALLLGPFLSSTGGENACIVICSRDWGARRQCAVRKVVLTTRVSDGAFFSSVASCATLLLCVWGETRVFPRTRLLTLLKSLDTRTMPLGARIDCVHS
ncbi:hypothetical protein B0T22DRAFT_454820 [Podospora appendiculata]|uniref:Uncharacterized protein n=1 Tax=Podospora appendiculata TaxID=314037 RepID=A0AAE1CI68_9PEZI|nr:hypothetical protein B0T22DRAFT_454820 [Podospora appendiculata]